MNCKKKVLFFITGLVSGGAERLINDMTPILNNKKDYVCDVLILTEKKERYKSELEKKGVSVYVSPYSPKNVVGTIFFLVKFVINNKYDLVYANLFPAIYYCSIAHKIAHGAFPPIIMTEHNTDNRRRHHSVFRPLERFIYKEYSKVICISDETKKSLQHWLKIEKDESYCVVFNGVFLDKYIYATSYPHSELNGKIAKDDVVLCMVASLTLQKNHQLALKIMKCLEENYKLIIIGEGNLKNEIEVAIKNNKLENRVFLLGYREDVPEIMHSSDIFILTSKWEGFGLVAVEAMASGIPTIVSDVPGLAEVVGDAGIKIANEDVQQYVNAIHRVSENDTIKLDYKKKQKEQYEKYDIQHMIDKYCEIFLDVLGKEE